MSQDLKYFRIHNWLIYHHGKATRCENENCKSINPKRFEWSLVKGKDYKKDRHNYIQLCPSCHREYDYTDEQRKKQSESGKKKVFTKDHRKNISISSMGKGCVKVLQKDKYGNIINEFESVSIAAKQTGILQTSISNVLTNRSKTAGGFKWEYKQMN